MGKWTSMWGQSHWDTSSYMPKTGKKTVCFWISAALSGSKLRIRFENRTVKKGFMIGDGAIIIGNNSYPITFDGKPEIRLLYNGCICSDIISCEIKEKELLQFRLYFPELQNPCSGNGLREQVDISKAKGNYVRNETFPSKGGFISKVVLAKGGYIPAVSFIDIYAKDDTKAIVAFGDSITMQSRWTKPLEGRLLREYGGKVSLINKGIGGNRLLRDGGRMKSYGEAGIKRFERDVLDAESVDTVIFSLGTNDIGLPGSKMMRYPLSELPEVEEYKRMVEQLVLKAHEKKVRFVPATIAPRNIVKNFAIDYSIEREEMRLEINEWFRESSLFDGMIDFDKVLKMPDGIGLRPDYDSGDGLHPNDNGGIVMANCIDLKEVIG